MSVPRLLLGAALTGWLGFSALPALEPEDLAESWRWRTFGREEGLPTGTISAIGHDRDDYVYAGTDRGLLRYNGFAWSALDAAEPFSGGPVVRIVESGGDVYAANRTELWLARYGLELHRVLKGARVLLAAGPLGGVYAIDLAGQIHYHVEKETLTRVDEGAPLPESEVFDYGVDDRRLHWLATRDGLYRRDIRNRSRWQPDPDLGPELRSRPCRKLFVLKRQVVFRGPAGALPLSEPPSFELWALFEGPGQPQGAPGGGYLLAQKTDSGWRVAAVDPSGPAISDLVLDGEGNYVAISEESRIFISSDGASFRPAPNPGVGWVALSGGFLDRHDYLWYRAGTSAIVRFDGQSRRWERYHRGMGLPSNNVLSLVESSDGSVWAGTDSGVYRYPKGIPGDPTVYRTIGDKELKSVTGLAEDRTGKIWISSESFEGVYFFHEGSWHRFEPREGKLGVDPGISAHPIRRIVADRGGDLWFLSSARAAPAPGSGGAPARPPGWLIYRYSASVYTLSTFRVLEFPHGPVNDLLQAQDKSYWLATDEGLWSTNALTEDLRLYNPANGLRSPRIWAIAEAADGAIWICYDPSSASGVTRIRGDRVETFDERNGLASPNAWSVAATIAPEGTDVWFGTDRGLIRFDGECWYSYSIASLDPQASQVWPIAIAGEKSPGEGLSILIGTFGQGVYRFRRDDRRRPRIVQLESERTPSNLVTFRWDGRDFKNETPPADLRFRTRIDNQPWTSFVPERSRTVAGLAAGEHVFQVEMRDLDGNSNREKYALHFLVPALPVLYSPLIWAAAGGAGGGLVLAALGAAIYLKLRRRPEPVRAALDASRAYAGFPGAAVVLDRDGRIVDLTGRRPECLGLPVDLARELLGRPAALLPLFQSERAKRALERLIAGEELLLDAVPLVPGQPRTAQVRGVPLLGRGGVPGVEPVSGAVLLVEEVTGVRRAAEVRERARRLSSLQELAGRIASELSSGGGDPRWSDLLRTLRRIAGEEDLRPESFSLAGLIDALLGKSPLNGRGVDGALKIPPGVELDLREQTGLWLVLADPRALELALRELLKNAVEAMPDGGRLTIRLRNRRLDDDPGELSPGAYLEVEVGDSGPGFPQAELHRAFEPFFSTKPRDRARGVGLSVAYGLVRRQGGDIRLASVPGEGTTVTLYLPADPGS